MMAGKRNWFKALLFSSTHLYTLARVSLGIVFVCSGIIKGSDLESFSNVIDAFAVLPSEFCYPAAVLVSSAEMIFGAALVADLKGSLAAISLMLLFFTGILGFALYMGYDIDCGCFGPQDPETKALSGLKKSLARDSGLILQALYLYLWRVKNNFHPIMVTSFLKRSGDYK